MNDWTVNNNKNHFAGTEQQLQKRTPEEVRFLKTFRDDADVTWRGRSFQVRAAATGKARSPTVDSRVRRTGSDVVSADRRRVLIPRSTWFPVKVLNLPVQSLLRYSLVAKTVYSGHFMTSMPRLVCLNTGKADIVNNR